ncbi:hypothetical protein BH11ACT5_BH11ACT5_19110 [soil metagenome]
MSRMTSALNSRASKIVAGVVAALLAVTGVGLIAAPALAAEPVTGTISGTVTVEQQGGGLAPAGLDDVLVTAWRYEVDEITGDPAAVSEGTELTDAGGSFSFVGLPTGAYDFQYEYRGTLPNIVDEFLSSYFTLDEALAAQEYSTPFNAIAEAEDVNADQNLHIGAQLTGTVRGVSDALLSGQPVAVWRQSSSATGDYIWLPVTNGPGGTAGATVTGSYRFVGLPQGQYTVRVGGASGYVAQYWENVYVGSPSEANAFWISQGETAVKDFTLLQGSKINGTVRTTTGTVLGGIVVTAYRHDGWNDNTAIATTSSASTGKYSFSLAPGDYVIGFSSPSASTSPYLDEYWKNVPSIGSATVLTLGAGATINTVDASLARSASISGTVSLAGGIGDFDVEVKACYQYSLSYADCSVGTATVGAGGTYRISNLLPGTYTVQVVYNGASNFRSEYFSNARDLPTATYFVLGASTAATGKNIVLDPGAQISGLVTVGGVPTSGVQVGVYLKSASSWDSDTAVRSVSTGANGRYTLSGLDFDTYLVRATPSSSSTSWQWYSGAYSKIQATSLSFSGATLTNGIDFSLVASSTLSGTVTGFDPEGGPAVAASGYRVTAYRYLGASEIHRDLLDYTYTGTNGDYSLSLPPGDYLVKIESDYWATDNKGYLPQFIGGAPGDTTTAVARISVASGSTVVNNVELAWGGAYTGRIVDAEGTGLGDVDIYEDGESATTDGDGYFTIAGLSTGAHTLELNTYGIDELGTKYSSQQYAAPALTTNSAAVDLGDVVLHRSSTFSGIVIGSNGKPVRNVTVRAWTNDGEVVGGSGPGVGYTTTSATGEFTLDDLPTSEPVYVLFDDNAGVYSPQYLGGSTVWSLSTPVIFSTEGTRKFSEVRLVAGGAITGVVTNTATGRAIPGIGVVASTTPYTTSEDSDWQQQSAVTNASGAYIVPGLWSGSFRVSFSVRDSGANMAFGSKETTVYVPERTTVKANASLVPTVPLSGNVKGPDGNLAGVSVTVYDFADGSIADDEPMLTAVETNSAGNYSLRVDPGVYVVRFTDPQGRVSTTYLGGTPDPSTPGTTVVTAAKTALTGKNVVLAAQTGSISATVVDAVGASRMGRVSLYRADGSAVGLDGYYAPLGEINKQFPMTNLAPGTYRLVITVYSANYAQPSSQSTYWSSQPIVVDNIVVGSGETVLNGGLPLVVEEDLIDVAAHDAASFPSVVPGSEPELSQTTGLQVGDTIVVDRGQWSPTPDDYVYRWVRDGRPITGATGDQYVVTPGDVGHTLRAEVGGGLESVGYGAYLSVSTAPTNPILPGDAANLLTPASATGEPRVGQLLQAVPGTWDLPNLAFSYQLVRSTSTAADVVVSTSSTYKPVTADVDNTTTNPTLALKITAKRPGFVTAAISVAIDPVQPATAMKQTVKSVVSTVVGGLKATAGTWSPTGATISYEWVQYAPDGSSTVLPGGEGATSILTDAAAISSADRIVVRVTATKAGYTPTTVAVLARQGAPVSLSTPPVIVAGAVQVGLATVVDTASAVTLPSGASWTYQWLRGGVAIAGATSSSYTPVALDTGTELSVRVTATVAGYPVGQVVLTAGSVLAPGTFTPSVAITGVTAVGRVLTADTAAWSPVPVTKTYKWTRNGTAIVGATKSTYALVAADLGATIGVTVTGSRLGYLAAPATATTGPITELAVQSLAAPSPGARALVGTKLTATTGAWDLPPTSFTYQWYVNGIAVVGATASTYTPKGRDLANEISVGVTAVRTGIPASAEVVSQSVTVEPGTAIAASALPLVTVSAKAAKTAKLNALLVATSGTWPVTSLDLTYQWQVSRDNGATWVNLEGATLKQLRLDASAPGDFAVGFLYRIVVSSVRVGYDQGPDAVSTSLKIIP